MKPINSKERKIAFIKFTGLFTVVVALVVIAVFCNFSIPSEEIKVLRNMNQRLTSQVALQEEIMRLSDSTQAEFVRIDQPDQLFKIVEGKISDNINGLQKFANDSSLQGKIVKNMHTTYIGWLKDKKALQENSDMPKELQKVKEELKETKEALRDCKNDAKD